MPGSFAHNLCSKNCSDGHFVQFYDDDRHLSSALAEYVRISAIERSAVVLLCTETHWIQLKTELNASEFPISDLVETGQVTFFDAAVALSRVLENGAPSRARFNAIIGEFVEQRRTKFKSVRFFGELVNLLCEVDRAEDALILEGYWNDFLRENSGVSLMCGYAARNVTGTKVRDRVVDTHSDVIDPVRTELLKNIDSLSQRINSLEVRSAMQRAKLREQEEKIAVAEAKDLHYGQFKTLIALGELCTSMAHELNNPLTVIRCSMTSLQNSVSEGPVDPRDARFSKVDLSVSRMSKLIRDVLSFTRRVGAPQSFTRLSSVLNESVTMVDEICQAQNISIVKEFDETIELQTDKDLLSQVIVNLALNAKDAITQKRSGQGKIVIAAKRLNEKQVEIRVSDDGCGMNEQTRSKVFSPYYTTKPVGYGTGIGLPLSEGIVKKLGGKIDCESQEGVGSIFKVMLPVQADFL
ncbi:MAG TPA: ATP-binding protein [Bdellovibrionales bacterium]|nr:ATP-binding protein [Bdellovibrionales bacterium]